VNWTILEGYLTLLRIEIPLSLHNLSAIHALVQNRRVREQPTKAAHTVEQLCRAIDLACIFYPKHVLCLQRSAATVMMLRHSGYKAEMIIGAQMIPFKSHAWVEIDGAVINDKPYMRDIYKPLEQW
jgi:hypothetical protein